MEFVAYWYADDEWRGFVLMDERATLAEEHVFVTWIAGMQHHDVPPTDPRLEPGTPVVVRHHRDNAYNPAALGVWTADGAAQIGFVPDAVVNELPQDELDRCGLVLAQMLDHGAPCNAWIVVAREPVSFRVVDAPADAKTPAVVRRLKAAYQRSAERTAFRNVDPLEQMRQAAEALRNSD